MLVQVVHAPLEILLASYEHWVVSLMRVVLSNLWCHANCRAPPKDGLQGLRVILDGQLKHSYLEKEDK